MACVQGGVSFSLLRPRGPMLVLLPSPFGRRRARLPLILLVFPTAAVVEEEKVFLSSYINLPSESCPGRCPSFSLTSLGRLANSILGKTTCCLENTVADKSFLSGDQTGISAPADEDRRQVQTCDCRRGEFCTFCRICSFDSKRFECVSARTDKNYI